jgi:hypothetical protein
MARTMRTGAFYQLSTIHYQLNISATFGRRFLSNTWKKRQLTVLNITTIEPETNS